MNTPTPAPQSRRQFLSSLATAAVAVPVAAALPSVVLPVPPRASVPLTWKAWNNGNVFHGESGYFGCVRVGGWFALKETRYFAALGDKTDNTHLGHETAAQARAAIQEQWDQLCGAEPAAVAAPKVRELEWKQGYQTFTTNHGSANEIKHREAVWVAHSRIGYARIVHSPDGFHAHCSIGDLYQNFPTLEAAKAAAQIHWETTVKGALV